MNHDTRPWGEYYVLDNAKSHKVKRIIVKPGGRLSYQYHLHRSEVWIVVSGEAIVTIEGDIKQYKPGDVVIIPLRAKHRIENRGNEDLIFIEVQLGSYFGEEDIIRIEDDYNRK